ncbi:MAG: ABC transporter permease subunit [Bacilli bacterium]|nr:ABC transporter permease subunit [Bacilli bacterium]
MARVKTNTAIARRHKKSELSPFTIFMLVVLIIFCIMLVGIVVWSLLIALTGNLYFTYNRTFDLSNLTIENFANIINCTIKRTSATGEPLSNLSIWQVYLLSFLYAAMCAFTNTLVPCLTSYFAARYNYKFSKIIYYVVLIVMLVPIIGSLPSEIAVVNALGLNDKIYVLWIMKANMLGLYFLVFFETFRAMPNAYFEAAKIDGAGNLTLLFKIAIPLVSQIFLTVFLIHFVEFWNEYQPPMVYMKSYPTVGYLLFDVSNTSKGEPFNGIPPILALSFFMFIPTVILFAFSHKRLMGNITVGGIKG